MRKGSGERGLKGQQKEEIVRGEGCSREDELPYITPCRFPTTTGPDLVVGTTQLDPDWWLAPCNWFSNWVGAARKREGGKAEEVWGS